MGSTCHWPAFWFGQLTAKAISETTEYGLGKGDTARRGRSVGPGKVRAGAGSWSGVGRASTGQGQGKERKVRTE